MKTKAPLTSIRMTLFCSILSANIAMAGNPVVCTPGYYDATCNVPISRPYQTPTTCSTGLGWTTVAPASWIGSQWTAPQCSYTPPPTCSSGYTQASAPWWNGSSWVGLSCNPPWSFDPNVQCAARLPAGYSQAAQPADALPYSYWTQANVAELGTSTVAQFLSNYGMPTNDTLYLVGAIGPMYQAECGQYNDWGAFCAVSPSNNIDGLWVVSFANNKPGCGGGN